MKYVTWNIFLYQVYILLFHFGFPMQVKYIFSQVNESQNIYHVLTVWSKWRGFSQIQGVYLYLSPWKEIFCLKNMDALVLLKRCLHATGMWFVYHQISSAF